MSRRPAIFTQADIARAVRAAKQAGAGGVELRPDGSIFIHLTKTDSVKKPIHDLDDQERAVF
jgi:hypothetical protein